MSRAKHNPPLEQRAFLHDHCVRMGAYMEKKGWIVSVMGNYIICAKPHLWETDSNKPLFVSIRFCVFQGDSVSAEIYCRPDRVLLAQRYGCKRINNWFDDRRKQLLSGYYLVGTHHHEPFYASVCFYDEAKTERIATRMAMLAKVACHKLKPNGTWKETQA